MTTKPFPANAVELYAGTLSNPDAGTMRIRMKTARYYTDNTRLAANTEYTVTRDWGSYAVEKGWAVDVLQLLPLMGTPNLARGSLYIEIPASGSHSDFVQKAAREAMNQGFDLVLGAGTWDLRSGGITMNDGPSDGSAAGFYIPKVCGVSVRATKILVGAGGFGIRFGSSGRNGQGGGVENLSIIGPGIGSGAVGIQFGGLSALAADLTTRMSISNVEIDNVTSALIVDDVSIFEINSLRLVRYKYGFEWGYNVDDVRIKNLYAGHEQTPLAGATCVITSGSNVITGLGTFVTSQLQVGYCVAAPGDFPAGCYVGSISSTSITVVNHNGVAVNATDNGTNVWFPLGRLFCFGTRVVPTAGTLYPLYGSPFVSPYWSATYPAQSGRVNATNHVYEGLANDQELIIDMGGGSHSLITTSMYQERFARLYRFGDPASDQQPQGFSAIRNYYGQNQTVVATPILVEANAAEFGMVIQDNFSDSSPLAYPWFRCDGFFGTGRLTWQRNNLQTTANRTVQLGSSNTTFAAQPKIEASGSMFLSSAQKGDAIQTWIGQTWLYYGQDVLLVDLAGGSKAVDLPLQYNISSTGKELTVRIIANGANTLTFGAGWFTSTGTAAGVVAAGTTGQTMDYIFRWLGSKFIAVNTPVWITP